MGADWFEVTSTGETAEVAFSAAVAQAQYDHGHAGYSGSLAEKSDFIQVLPGSVFEGKQAAEEISRRYWRKESFNGLPMPGQAEVDDKWGPAGVVEYVVPGSDDGTTRHFLIFGWAAS